MTLRVVLPLLLTLSAAPALAQFADPTYGYAQSGYGADGQSVESIDVFYAPLARYGRWLDSRYGRVWAPNVGRDWRPYTIGHWEEGSYGQTWRSDEPFGWAVFHFGRWAFDQQIGWVWSPDTVWGPGWVAWRDSDDVTGWAPLPPQVSVGFALGSGFGFNDWGYDQWYQPGWVYVPRGNLYARSLRGAYLPYARNREIWEHTRGVTRYDRVDGQVVNRSFGRRDGDFGRDGGRDFGRDRRNFGRDGSRDFDRDGGSRGFDGRGDSRREVDRRDEGSRRNLRSVQPYGTVPPVVAVPPVVGTARDAYPANRGFDRRDPTDRRDGSFGQPRGLDRRDGFVPGQPQRGFDRRMAAPSATPMAVSPVAMPRPLVPLAPPAMARPAMPTPMAAPPPPPREPRPEPQPTVRRRMENSNERPR